PARAAATALPQSHDLAHRRVPARLARWSRAAVGGPRVLGGGRDRPLRPRLLVFRPREGRLRERPVMPRARAARRARPVARDVFWREVARVLALVRLVIISRPF